LIFGLASADSTVAAESLNPTETISEQPSETAVSRFGA